MKEHFPTFDFWYTGIRNHALKINDSLSDAQKSQTELAIKYVRYVLYQFEKKYAQYLSILKKDDQSKLSLEEQNILNNPAFFTPNHATFPTALDGEATKERSLSISTVNTLQSYCLISNILAYLQTEEAHRIEHGLTEEEYQQLSSETSDTAAAWFLQSHTIWNQHLTDQRDSIILNAREDGFCYIYGCVLWFPNEIPGTSIREFIKKLSDQKIINTQVKIDEFTSKYTRHGNQRIDYHSISRNPISPKALQRLENLFKTD